MKLDILFHYNVDEKTGEITFIGKEEITVDTAKKSTSTKTITSNTKVLGGDKARLVLEDNKYLLNQAAADLLGAEAGDTIHIHYRKLDKSFVPSIGRSEALGVKSGNKLTKSLTVSYKGQNNEKLAEYGNEFTFAPTDKLGVYYLVGNKDILTDPAELDTIDINDDIKLDSLDDLDLEDNSTDINGLDLSF